MSAEEIQKPSPAANAWEGGALNMTEELPDLFERFFAFFRPAHTEGIAPARVKELARLKIAAMNECDT
ncbi:MAG: hypothetical protein NXI30_14010 [bacterium]|nr:hypothetical protein [bacterium]